MKEIIKKIGIGFDNKISIKRKRSTVYLWWEDDTKDLLNINDKKENFQILNKEVESYLEFAYKEFKLN